MTEIEKRDLDRWREKNWTPEAYEHSKWTKAEWDDFIQQGLQEQRATELKERISEAERNGKASYEHFQWEARALWLLAIAAIAALYFIVRLVHWMWETPMVGG